MADVNAAVRTTLIRRAIERTRFENEVLKEIRAVWRQVIPQILLAVRTAGIHEKGAGTVTRLAIGGNAGGNMRLGDQRQRLAEVMAGIATLWRQAVADATRRLRGNLKQFVELELLELPTSVQDVVEKHFRKQESAFMEYSPDQLRDDQGRWTDAGGSRISIQPDEVGTVVAWRRALGGQLPTEDSLFLYHATTKDRLPSIARRGLVPDAGGEKRFPGFSHGAHVSMAPSVKDAEYWSSQLFWRQWDATRNPDQPILLRVANSTTQARRVRPDEVSLDHVAPENIERWDADTSEWKPLVKRLREADADDAIDAFADAPRIGVRFASVPAAQMSELLTSPLGGANFAQSFEDLSTRVLTRLRNVLSGGLLRGEGVPKVTRAVKGLLDGTRWEAERIVRSEYVRVAGQAALIQFDGNKELLDGVRWVSALDDRTCLQCGDMDGEEWEDATDAPVPVVDTHPNCRCVIVPVVKDLPGFAFGPSTRAAQDGPVSGKETFTTWFPQQDAAFQRATLGPTRYKLFKAGALKLGDFSTAAGTRSVADALALAKRRGN